MQQNYVFSLYLQNNKLKIFHVNSHNPQCYSYMHIGQVFHINLRPLADIRADPCFPCEDNQ